MCGIAGIISTNEKAVTFAELRHMCAAMIHRGPDDEGLYVDDHIGLGMRRLSIIDLNTGSQPVHNEDGSIWVVLNGEIYNYQELRSDLQKRGHIFYTRSDTEVIVHLYEEFNIDCVTRLRGMFAFAVWNGRSNTLMLARDRLGIKPMYYTDVGGRFAFASELKVLMQIPELEHRLNLRAINHLVHFLTTPANESIIAGVGKLEPGNILTISTNGIVHRQRYWDAHFEPDYSKSEADFIARLRELLEESVRLHMVSDVPVGAFLSGGIDSSAVVAAMAKISTKPLQTFSIGFHERDFNELDHAREVARHFHTQHHELVVDPDIEAMLEDLTWYMDEPFGDPSSIPTYLISKMASRQVTVILSGDGGDELFAGYDKYVVESRERRVAPFAAPLRTLLHSIAMAMPTGASGRNFLHHFSLAGVDRYLDALAFYRPDECGRLFRPEVYDQLFSQDAVTSATALLQHAEGHWLSSLQYFDLHRYLPLDILTKVDRMSMAHSIEARVPLLDHKLVEFAGSIPPSLKLRKGRTKHIFKQAMAGILPDSIINRKKQGFAVPLKDWFRGPLSEYLRDHLLSERCRRRGIFNTAYIEKLITLHDQGRPLDLQLWTLLSIELWCRLFLDYETRRVAPTVIVPTILSRSRSNIEPDTIH